MTDQFHTIADSGGHGGNVHQIARQLGLKIDEILDFSANINPLGPPSWLRPLISRELDFIGHYPDSKADDFRRIIAAKYQVPHEAVIVANGSTELLYLLPYVLKPKRVVIPCPSYIDYNKVARLADIEVLPLFMHPEDDFILDCDVLGREIKKGDLVIIGSPNNPTARVVEPEKIKALARSFPESFFMIDEAFLDFVDDAYSSAGAAMNIITLHSLTKFYGIPGLRLGFGIFPPELGRQMENRLPPWSVNSLAQAVGKRLIDDEEYGNRSRKFCNKLRNDLLTDLRGFSALQLFDSSVNYLLVQLKNKTAAELATRLLDKRILIRDCGNYPGLDNSFIRLAVRTESENKRLISALQEIYFPGKKIKKTRKTQAASLMFQGTSSNAGKSVLTAAFCRILIQDGLRVAPFKSQNMSLNSYVTHDGLEMGRAQVVQAQAACLDPDVRMNPILIKPNSDTGSQIIVQGKAVCNMSVMEYVRFKKEAVQSAWQSYDELADEFEVVLLEGAGSPGEVNLKAHDIVNMQMARYASAPVLLVGDIDRGGVYASFVGTMEVLEQWERQLVAGFLVNRFRGQASLLQSAHDYVSSHTGKEVLGVVPYLHDLGIPEEDSVSFKAGLFESSKPQQDHVEIVLLSLPHISNFTDLEAFHGEPDVFLRVVERVEDLGQPDAVILPGSKNVIGDLAALRESAIADTVCALARSGCEIVGICGGYQMLGSKIEDPHFIESDRSQTDGLGLLEMTTVLEPVKSLTRQQGIHQPSGLEIHGYEIHHGLSSSGLEPLLRFVDNKVCGSMSENGRIWGSYLHGIFDADLFRRWFIDTLRKRKGLSPLKQIQASYDLEPAFDRLADIVRENVDMDKIYQLLKL